VQFAAPRTRMSQVRSRALHQSTNSHKTAKQLAEAKIAKSRPNTLKSCSRWYGPVVDRLFPRHADKWKNIPTAHVGCSPGLHIGHSDLYPSLSPRRRTLVGSHALAASLSITTLREKLSSRYGTAPTPICWNLENDVGVFRSARSGGATPFLRDACMLQDAQDRCFDYLQ